MSQSIAIVAVLLGLAFTDCGTGYTCTDTTAIDTTNNTYTLGSGGTGLAAGGNLTTASSGYVAHWTGSARGFRARQRNLSQGLHMLSHQGALTTRA